MCCGVLTLAKAWYHRGEAWARSSSGGDFLFPVEPGWRVPDAFCTPKGFCMPPVVH